MRNTNSLSTLLAGVAGAVAVNVVHELTRYAAGGNPSSDRVPRLDRLGQDGVVLAATSLGLTPPRRGMPRYAAAMAGDLAINAGLYALTAGLTKSPLVGGTVAALAAGVSGLLTPKLIGLERHTGTTAKAKAMTFADYAIGGVVTGLVLAVLTRSTKSRPRQS
jgi:hypothetical protein